MAKLYPTSLNEYGDIDDSVKLLYNKLQSLDDKCHVFHSSAWNIENDGECDFIIFHEQNGFIAFEVRCGSIDFNGKKWYCKDSSGDTHIIKDPVKKARDSMRAFKRLYEDRFKTALPGICTWGVCFFDFRRGDGYRTLDISDANIIDYHDSENIKDWVDNLFNVSGYNYCVRKLSENEKDNFLSLFNTDIKIPLYLERIVLEQQRKMNSIDYIQENILDLFEDKSRIAFHGAAGTGKTRLAMKKALRLATSGKRVLYLCFNRPVSENINLKFRTNSNIDVMTFHSFGNTVIKEYISFEINRFACENDFFSCIDDLRKASGIITTAGYRQRRGDSMRIEHRVQSAVFSLAELISGIEYDEVLACYENKLPLDLIDMLSLLIPEDSDNENFFNVRIPLALALAFENTGWNVSKFTYDAVIIDEGHDFHKNWCDSLKNLFEKYRHRTVYVFYDENQTIYRRQKELPIRDLISKSDHNHYIFRLKDNVRNTAVIHDYAAAKTGLAVSTQALDIPGIAPEEIEFSDPVHGAAYTGRIIRDLVIKHGIDLNSIVILSNRSMENSIFADNKNAGIFPLSSTGALIKEDAVRYRTINEFKGLDSDIVILVLHKREEEFADKSRYLSEELLYVGFTRARFLLYVVNIIDNKQLNTVAYGS